MIPYTQLKEYKRKHGHVRIPQKLDEPKGLGNWVLDQRRRYRERGLPEDQKSSKKGPMSQEEIDKLESIGFEWSIRSRGGGTGNSGNSSYTDATSSCNRTVEQVGEIFSEGNGQEGREMDDFVHGPESDGNTTTVAEAAAPQDEEDGIMMNQELVISPTNNLQSAAEKSLGL
jgi:hypothetical protein